jgi:peptide/nickel transport system substrate-binding protein
MLRRVFRRHFVIGARRRAGLAPDLAADGSGPFRLLPLLAVAAAALLLAGLTACGGDSGDSGQTTGTLAENTSPPVEGGDIVASLEQGQNVTWFNPILSAGACTAVNYRTIQSTLYRPIISFTPEVTIDSANSMASKIEVANRGTNYTVTLKPWKWSDGSAITAADVATYFYVLKNGALADSCLFGIGGMPDLVDGFKIISDNQFQVQYAARPEGYNPDWVELSGFPGLTALPTRAWLNLCPGTGFDPTSPTASAAKKLWACLKESGSDYRWKGWDVVSGPFKIDPSRWQPKTRFVFKANKAFSGTKPKLDRLTMLAQASSTNTFTGLRSGSIDVGRVPASLASQASALSGYKTALFPVYAESRITLNLKTEEPRPKISKAFQDKAVRVALQHGVDSDVMIQKLANDAWYPNYGPIPSRPDTYVSPQLRKASAYPFDIEKGSALLEQAGWQMSGGVRSKDGVALRFGMTYPAGDTTVASVAQLLKSDWGKMGIAVQLSSIPTDDLLAKAFDPAGASELDSVLLVPTGWEYFPDFYPTGETLYKCDGAVTQYFGFVCDPKLDRLIEQTTEFSGTKSGAQNRLNAYQNYIADNALSLFAPAGGGLLAVSDSVGGVAGNYNSFAWSPEHWYRTR